jgi:hypothetical protein
MCPVLLTTEDTENNPRITRMITNLLTTDNHRYAQIKRKKVLGNRGGTLLRALVISNE